MSEDFCRHINVTEEGYCTECGVLARVRFPLEKRKPMSSEISYAVETFEEACDEAIAKIGEENAYRILCQRKERAQIILRMAPKEKNSWEQVRAANQAGMAGQLADYAFMESERKAREDATAQDARQRMEEEKVRGVSDEERDKREDEHIAMIKAMNKAGL